MPSLKSNSIHAALFGLTDDLAGELLKPLSSFCSRIQSISDTREPAKLAAGADGSATVIFCGTDAAIVSKLRESNPQSPIVVVSRHADVSCWLDSIEAGATDYCAAPFEASQVQWILESSIRSFRQTPAAA